MKPIQGTLLAAMVAAMFAVQAVADNTPLAVSAQFTYSLDSLNLDLPHTMRTAADISGHPIVWRKGDTVTATAADGTLATLATAAANDGSLAWTPVKGGVWTLTNDVQGTAVIVVRHSLCGTSGDGTEASPARFVDGDELSELCTAGTAGNGFVFMLDGLDTLTEDLVVPSGFSLEHRTDGTWRIVTAVGDLLFSGESAATYSVDSRKAGPHRRLDVNDSIPIAYTGDNWLRNPMAASTLTIVSPSGMQTQHDLTGTSTLPFRPVEKGEWIIALVSGDDNLRASINVAGGFVMMFR